MKRVLSALIAFCIIAPQAFCADEPAAEQSAAPSAAPSAFEYIVGVDDVLDISVLQPEKLLSTVVVSPDGSISFPYIGTVVVRGQTLSQVQKTIEEKLADGYMKYPIVSVALKESRSRKFFVYGEVIKPGTYYINENVTVLRGITMAGGFSKFGSSKVKVLRPNRDRPGYTTIRVDIKAVMEGNAGEDLVLEPEDIIVVTQGIF
ncbi:MAG TPA: polysaccharide biosynthesis/export family protein [Candidatus Omnitrophota bacterium]|nr:polysaccharide biosynthesis/export family protein [Candidatus Omnitrophota bacterium]